MQKQKGESERLNGGFGEREGVVRMIALVKNHASPPIARMRRAGRVYKWKAFSPMIYSEYGFYRLGCLGKLFGTCRCHSTFVPFLRLLLYSRPEPWRQSRR